MTESRTTGRIAWGLAAGAFVLAAAAPILLIAGRVGWQEQDTRMALDLSVAVGWGILGGIVVSRQPENVIGRLFLFVAVVASVDAFAYELTAALESQARKATMRVSIDADGIGRYPAEVEAAAYFCCLEALQNAAKYAHASEAWVRLASSPTELSFSARDQGSGFDPRATSFGAGLQNMSDRLAALGGSIRVDSRPGKGTTVTGRIPIPT